MFCLIYYKLYNMLHLHFTKQFLKTDLNTLWNFMSSPENLAKITPTYMGFHILSDLSESKMEPGQIIEYYVTPVAGIKMHWVTEITHVKEKEFFVDEQRFGPYAFWHHKHILREVPGGVEMLDYVHYKVPFGFIGRLMNKLLVRKKIAEIFGFRYDKLDQLFNKTNS
jgi:ligand-binding SRPBCC domain-containing protein